MSVVLYAGDVKLELFSWSNKTGEHGKSGRKSELTEHHWDRTPGSMPEITIPVAQDIGWRAGARGEGRRWQSTYSGSDGALDTNQNPVMTS